MKKKLPGRFLYFRSFGWSNSTSAVLLWMTSAWRVGCTACRLRDCEAPEAWRFTVCGTCDVCMVCRRHLLLRGQKGLALDMSMWIRLFSRNQSVIGKYFIPVIVISSVLVVQHHPIRWLTVCRRRRYILWCCSVLLYFSFFASACRFLLVCFDL